MKKLSRKAVEKMQKNGMRIIDDNGNDYIPTLIKDEPDLSQQAIAQFSTEIKSLIQQAENNTQSIVNASNIKNDDLKQIVSAIADQNQKVLKEIHRGTNQILKSAVETIKMLNKMKSVPVNVEMKATEEKKPQGFEIDWVKDKNNITRKTLVKIIY